ncbi:hypothetical protein GTQ40_15165 [Flavobacteriaceae bacterium R38]|nr:hypothetical protein [Flavobacteriaceae bacterium R38]
MSKKHLVIIFFLGGVVLNQAQNKQLLYDFNEIPQSLLTNPGAKINNRWHAGIPFLSGIYVNAGVSGFDLNDLFADNGVNFNDKIRNILSGISRNDVISLNQQLEIFNIGFRKDGWRGRAYYSFGIYEEIDFFAYFPKDLAILAFEGNGNAINRPFNLADLNVKGEALTVFHFGINKKVNEKLTYGLRAKIYSSILDFNTTGNRGSFITVDGQDNFLRHQIDADLKLRTSGYNSFREAGSEGFLGNFRKRAFLGGNLGLGFDLGFTYEPKEQWTVTGSLQDLGFIWHANDVETYTIEGQFELEGVELPFPDLIDGNDGLEENIDGTFDNIQEQVPLDTISNQYIRLRPLKLNSSVKYSFGEKKTKIKGEECDCKAKDKEYKNAVGAQLFAIGRSRTPLFALTLFYQTSLTNFLDLKTTYTVDKFSAKNIGLGVSTDIGNLNFYILADNLLDISNVAKINSFSFQMGFNIKLPETEKPY